MLWAPLKECINIHAYQNVINFDYYFNVFQPNIVIFESAEYTLNTNYYNQEKMKEIQLNPVLDKNTAKKVNADLFTDVQDHLVHITVKTSQKESMYLEMNGKTFDLFWNEEEKLYYADIDKNNLSEKYTIYAVGD